MTKRPMSLRGSFPHGPEFTSALESFRPPS